MLKTACTHPEILKVLASCGHGDKILIADGNYPVDSNTNTSTNKVYLNLTHGIPTVTQVLDVISSVAPIEKAEVMMPDTGKEPEIFSEFRNILGDKLKLDYLDRYEFYDQCKKENIKLAIATGEQRVFANILLTIGVA